MASNDINYKRGSVTGSALAVDASDPNTASPPATEVVGVPFGDGKTLNAIFFADQACVLELWMRSDQLGKWIRLSQTTIATAWVGVVVAAIPSGFPIWLRVQANAGSAKVAGLIFA